MSETTAYLIPRKQFEIGDFKSQIETVLERLKLIKGYYDEGSNWFAAGENAHALFAGGSLNQNPPFEYVEIHDTENTRLIPEGLNEAVECKNCRTDLSEDVNSLLFAITEREYDEKQETEMAAVEILCTNCSQKSKLSALSYHQKIIFAHQYVSFVDILDDLDQTELADIEKQMGTSFEIIYGSI